MSVRRLRLYRLRWFWWSISNWREGYRFGPVQRCRWCAHTTPYHYKTCRMAGVRDG